MTPHLRASLGEDSKKSAGAELEIERPVRLDRQSRVAGSDRRARRGRPQFKHAAAFREDPGWFGPQHRDDKRHAGIVQVVPGFLRKQRFQAIVASFQARRLRIVRVLVVARTRFRMPSRYGDGMRRIGRSSGRDRWALSMCFQHACIGNPGSRSEKPHQQRHGCRGALGAGVREKLHAGAGSESSMYAGIARKD